MGRFASTNTFHAPLAEKMEDELVCAIVRGQYDSAECRAELHRRGWTDAHIENFGKRYVK